MQCSPPLPPQSHLAHVSHDRLKAAAPHTHDVVSATSLAPATPTEAPSPPRVRRLNIFVSPITTVTSLFTTGSTRGGVASHLAALSALSEVFPLLAQPRAADSSIRISIPSPPSARPAAVPRRFLHHFPPPARPAAPCCLPLQPSRGTTGSPSPQPPSLPVAAPSRLYMQGLYMQGLCM